MQTGGDQNGGASEDPGYIWSQRKGSQGLRKRTQKKNFEETSDLCVANFLDSGLGVRDLCSASRASG